jgi:RNA polymerase sigma-70 factor (ECF subfamily)
MELTYSAMKSEEIPPLPTQRVESGPGALSETASATVMTPSAAGLHNPSCRAYVSVSALNYGHASDEQLLVAARSGDERAFVELSSRYTASVQRKVFAILRNREDAEDAVQEALFKAYTHLGQFRGACKFSTWLTRIAINSALMQLRQRRSHFEVSFHQRRDDEETWEILDVPDPSPDAEQVYARHQAIGRLSHAVQRLPSSYRTIVSEYHEQERPLKETADNLGITLSAAKSRLLRARIAIRSILKSDPISMASACF